MARLPFDFVVQNPLDMEHPRSEYTQTFQEAHALAHRIADGLSDEAFNWKPDPKRWSVGECFVHLNKIAKGYLGPMEVAVGEDAPRGDGPFRYGWVSRTFIGAVRPGSRPMPTGGDMKPTAVTGTQSSVDKARALSDFDAFTDRFVALIERSDGLDIGRIRVSSPFLRLLRLPVGAFMEALSLHNLRHMQQAERVTHEPAFPRH